MRISDWSSDVCSSDLDRLHRHRDAGRIGEGEVALRRHRLRRDDLDFPGAAVAVIKQRLAVGKLHLAAAVHSLSSRNIHKMRARVFPLAPPRENVTGNVGWQMIAKPRPPALPCRLQSLSRGGCPPPLRNPRTATPRLPRRR